MILDNLEINSRKRFSAPFTIKDVKREFCNFVVTFVYDNEPPIVKIYDVTKQPDNLFFNILVDMLLDKFPTEINQLGILIGRVVYLTWDNDSIIYYERMCNDHIDNRQFWTTTRWLKTPFKTDLLVRLDKVDCSLIVT